MAISTTAHVGHPVARIFMQNNFFYDSDLRPNAKAPLNENYYNCRLKTSNNIPIAHALGALLKAATALGKNFYDDIFYNPKDLTVENFRMVYNQRASQALCLTDTDKARVSEVLTQAYIDGIGAMQMPTIADLEGQLAGMQFFLDQELGKISMYAAVEAGLCPNNPAKNIESSDAYNAYLATQEALLVVGANPDKILYGYEDAKKTSLYAAVEHHGAAMAELFLKYGANPNQQIVGENTPWTRLIGDLDRFTNYQTNEEAVQNESNIYFWPETCAEDADFMRKGPSDDLKAVLKAFVDHARENPSNQPTTELWTKALEYADALVINTQPFYAAAMQSLSRQ